jgi:hypothetical protein
MRLPYRLCPSPIVSRQQLGKHVPSATNTQATIEESLDAVFYVLSVPYKILSM